MRIDKIVVLARREYLSRVRTKGFWIGTVILPLFMAAMMFLPSLLLSRSQASLRLAIVDETGKLAEPLHARLASLSAAQPPAAATSAAAEPQQSTRFDLRVVLPAPDLAAQRRALDRQVLAKDIDAWLRIGADALERNEIEYHGESVSNFLTQERLERTISEVARGVRLREAGYDEDKVAALTRSLNLQTVRITEAGGRSEGGPAGFLVAFFLFFMLYMVLAIYGQQVMTGVLEEKNSRVVEVMISTVKPLELLIGKLTGIGLVGFTQLAIWLATAAFITHPGVGAALAWMPGGLPSIPLVVIVNFLIFFVLGFFLYATYYAAIGAAFNDIREAQQMGSSALIFLLPPLMMAMTIINDPDSTMAVVLSLVPLFSPLLMMLRIAVKMPPLWQVLLSYVLTAATTAGMIWVCAKIYRVGILMYGKKPTVKELWQWIRYAD